MTNLKVQIEVSFYSKPNFQLIMTIFVDDNTPQKFIKIYNMYNYKNTVVKHDIFWTLAHMNYFPIFEMSLSDYDDLCFAVFNKFKLIYAGGNDDAGLVEWPIHLQNKQ